MSAFYELVGRIVVRLAWARYGRQLTIAGVVVGAVLAAAAWAIASREPPEG
jgi:hypothetical protein